MRRLKKISSTSWKVYWASKILYPAIRSLNIWKRWWTWVHRLDSKDLRLHRRCLIRKELRQLRLSWIKCSLLNESLTLWMASIGALLVPNQQAISQSQIMILNKVHLVKLRTRMTMTAQIRQCLQEMMSSLPFTSPKVRWSEEMEIRVQVRD